MLKAHKVPLVPQVHKVLEDRKEHKEPQAPKELLELKVQEGLRVPLVRKEQLDQLVHKEP